MTIKIGDTIPDITFTTMTETGPEPVGADFFKGRTIALFAVPGAFTPTCSAKHLPGFLDKCRRAQGQGCRRDRLHLGQRRVRDGRLGEGERCRRQGD